jgi:hypothetical protein
LPVAKSMPFWAAPSPAQKPLRKGVFCFGANRPRTDDSRCGRSGGASWAGQRGGTPLAAAGSPAHLRQGMRSPADGDDRAREDAAAAQDARPPPSAESKRRPIRPSFSGRPSSVAATAQRSARGPARNDPIRGGLSCRPLARKAKRSSSFNTTVSTHRCSRLSRVRVRCWW